MSRLARTFCCFGLLSMIGAAAGRAQGTPPPAGIEKVVLGEGIYLFRASSDLDKWTSSNSVVFVNDTDVVVFDSNARSTVTALVLAEIRKITAKPVRTLINSHWHLDHWYGNEVYAKAFPGLEVIATEVTRDFMTRMPQQFFVNMVGLARREAALESAIRTKVVADGTPLTDAARKAMEAEIAEVRPLAADVAAAKRILPTRTFTDTLSFFRGGREFRLFSADGDAAGSAVLYLPREKLLVTGDVLVRMEEGEGPQPWTTNSYRITPWLESLQHLDALDVTTIVPGQGPVLRDKEYLRATIALYDAIIKQVHAAEEAGAATLAEVRAAVKLDDIKARLIAGRPGHEAHFESIAAALIRKVYQESHDGIAGTN